MHLGNLEAPIKQKKDDCGVKGDNSYNHTDDVLYSHQKSGRGPWVEREHWAVRENSWNETMYVCITDRANRQYW